VFTSAIRNRVFTFLRALVNGDFDAALSDTNARPQADDEPWTADRLHRHCHSTLAMRCEMFFMTLATRPIADKNRIGRNSSRIPTLHRGHLSVHDCQGRETQGNRQRDKRILFHKSVH